MPQPSTNEFINRNVKQNPRDLTSPLFRTPEAQGSTQTPSAAFLLEFFLETEDAPAGFAVTPPGAHVLQFLLFNLLVNDTGEAQQRGSPPILTRERIRQGLGIFTPALFGGAVSGAFGGLTEAKAPASSPANSGPNKLLVRPDDAPSSPANSGPNKLLVRPDDAPPASQLVIDMPDMGHMDDPPPKR